MLRDVGRAAPKAAGSFDRTCTFRETLVHEASLRARYGITRIAELTYLDRIGIPVYAAIVPDANDTVSVYLGKGITQDAARTGAVMEAAERQAASHARLPVRTLDVRALDDVIRPRRSAAGTVQVTLGYDLLAEREIDVPWPGVRTSNGLASGNTASEAVYHALCELVERHVLSVVHAIAHERPREIVARLAGGRIDVPGFVDDSVATEYAIPTGSAIVDRLIAQILAAEFDVRLRAVELRPFPALFVATISERGEGARSHPGYGCSLSPEHAAIRALTEAAQVRLVDIQAVREDLLPADDPFGAGDFHRRPTPHLGGSWYFGAPARPSTLPLVRDRSGPDLAGDVDAMLRILRSAGCRRVAIVDLSPPEIPIAVVRALVPDLETAMIDGVIGPLIASILDVAQDFRGRDLIVL